MGRAAQGAGWRRACTAALAAWLLAWSGVPAAALASSPGPAGYSPATPSNPSFADSATEPARLEASSDSPPPSTGSADGAAVAVAAGSGFGRGASDASASARVTIRLPAAVRLSVLADGAPPVTARAVQGAAGSLSASVAARMRTASGPKPVEVRVFANTPWALFVRVGEGPADGVQLRVQPTYPALGPLRASPVALGAEAFTLLPQAPGKLLVRWQQPGETVLSLQVAEVPAPAGLTAASEVELWFHLVSLGSGAGR